ncbi:MAG: UDP-glucose 4-epimerase GalE [Candidatus Latescibacterota bacterium]|nr:MAG: UDP-glucose 4-epimerase GalE [Candidatus Latescibacterota bacterium]
MQEPILVTGGAGYIGSHTCKVLAQSGFRPVVLDNLVYGHREAVKWGPFFEGNVSDTKLVRQIVREHGIRAIVHFAAYAYVGESMQQPEKYFQNNVVQSMHMLQAALENGVEHVVFSSTCAVYGEPESVPIREEQSLRPVSPYGESKLIVERALHWLGAAHDLGWVALRYFNAAGADPEQELGEEHDPETHLIPLVIQAALGRLPYLEIYGTDYDTPDGTAIRDYIHVTDLADAHVRALRYLMQGGRSVALNLGTGEGSSVREVVAAVERSSGRSVPVREVGRRPGDPPVLVADPARARSVLEWAPRYPDLQQIVDTAFAWHASRPSEPEGEAQR